MSSTVQKSRSVLISGASIAGPTLAFWLDRYGFDVTVVERASAVRNGGYPIDIRGTAIDVAPVAFTAEFTEQSATVVQWRAFRRRLAMEQVPSALTL